MCIGHVVEISSWVEQSREKERERVWKLFVNEVSRGWASDIIIVIYTSWYIYIYILEFRREYITYYNQCTWYTNCVVSCVYVHRTLCDTLFDAQCACINQYRKKLYKKNQPTPPVLGLREATTSSRYSRIDTLDHLGSSPITPVYMGLAKAPYVALP